MPKNRTHNQPENPSRRTALRRLAGAVVSAYVVPEILFLSEARAESGSSNPTAPTPPSAPSVPAPSSSTPAPSAPSPAAGPSSSGGGGQRTNDSCDLRQSGGGSSISISRSDLSRSQDAIEAGYAKPLDQIWSRFVAEYDGKIIGIEFTGARRNPRYRFRAISKRGRLETVTISAQTGEVIRIVGC